MPTVRHNPATPASDPRPWRTTAEVVLQESIYLFGRGRQAGQAERRSPQQITLVRWTDGLKPAFFQLGEDEVIEIALGQDASLTLGNGDLTGGWNAQNCRALVQSISLASSGDLPNTGSGASS